MSRPQIKIKPMKIQNSLVRPTGKVQAKKASSNPSARMKISSGRDAVHKIFLASGSRRLLNNNSFRILKLS